MTPIAYSRSDRCNIKSMILREQTPAAPALSGTEMAAVVAPYPPGVLAVPGPIARTAFFPGGLGLWLEADDTLQPFPKDFMVVGQDFNTLATYERARKCGSEVNSSATWRNLRTIFMKFNVSLTDCFFTNIYMGLRAVGPETGRFPGVRASAVLWSGASASSSDRWRSCNPRSSSRSERSRCASWRAVSLAAERLAESLDATRSMVIRGEARQGGSRWAYASGTVLCECRKTKIWRLRRDGRRASDGGGCQSANRRLTVLQARWSGRAGKSPQVGLSHVILTPPSSSMNNPRPEMSRVLHCANAQASG